MFPFVRHYETFPLFCFVRLFENLLMSPKGPSFNFLICCNRMYVKKNPKGPLLRVFGTMRFTGDIFWRTNRFFSHFSFVERFSVEQHGFFAVSNWGKGDFRVLCVSFRVIFSTVKLMKVMMCPFAHLRNI